MKKILSIALAMVMVMALSIAVFADADLTGNASYPLNDNVTFDIPEGVDVSNGATVTINVKGTSDNTAVRFYLTTPGDSGRVTEVAVVEVVDGAFDTTLEMVIDSTGAIQGAEDPTIIMVKGPDYATPLANTTFESIVVVAEGAAAPADETPDADEAPEADETPAADEAPVADAPAADETPAPAADSKPANTGIVLAVLPMAIAAAAVVASKRR